MEKYAVIQLGGKQFKVIEGQKFSLERQKDLKNDVLLYSDGKETLIGEPIVAGIEVNLKKIEDLRDKKIRIGRYKSKSRYRKIKGHRQPISVVEVVYIGTPKKEAAKEEKKDTKKPETKKVETKKPVAKKSTSSKKESK